MNFANAAPSNSLAILAISVFGTMLVNGPAIRAQVVPSAKDLSSRVFASEISVASGRLNVTYRLVNSSGSAQAISQFGIKYQPSLEVDMLAAPPNWTSSASVGGQPLAGWTARSTGRVKPGSEDTGFSLEAVGALPGVVDAFLVGWVPVERFPVFSGDSAPESLPGSSIIDNSIHVQTVGPVPVPLKFDSLTFLQVIIDYKVVAGNQGWIVDQGIGFGLDARLESARSALAKGDSREAGSHLRAMLVDVNAQAGRQLTTEAVALLKFNTEFLLERLSAIGSGAAVRSDLDVTGDGRVNCADVSFVRARFGQVVSEAHARADTTGDGVVDDEDIVAVAQTLAPGTKCAVPRNR